MLTVLLMVGLSGCAKSAEDRIAEAKASASAAARIREALSSKIRYEVTGDAEVVSVTIKTPTGTTQGDSNLPMRSKAGNDYLEFTYDGGDFVYISAQNKGDTGSVTCRITTDDGRVISENTSSSGYGIATCEGTAE